MKNNIMIDTLENIKHTASSRQNHLSGILPVQFIKKLIANKHINASQPITNAQIQPASIDLRLGEIAYRVRASFLPGSDNKVSDRLNDMSLHTISLTEGAVLETGCVYIVPLLETLELPEHISAICNPKSSTGRIDVFTRVITDYAKSFDQVSERYKGDLYLEISPRTFPIVVRTGSKLSQIRFRQGNIAASDQMMTDLQLSDQLVSSSIVDINKGIALSVDLSSENSATPIGFRAKRHAGLIDIDKVAACRIKDYWEPIWLEKKLVLDPDEFYILVSKESVRVPPGYAAEMAPFDPLVGEFRVHYAGFFDPGFGHSSSNGEGSRAVLEVRSHDVPFMIEDEQIIGRLIYEPLISEPEFIYGNKIGSNYQKQKLKLSKHFLPLEPDDYRCLNTTKE